MTVRLTDKEYNTFNTYTTFTEKKKEYKEKVVNVTLFSVEK